jgi:uncharacterized protein (TIGR04255 family)
MKEKDQVPTRLRKEPLLEAIWEIRFAHAKQSVADLLPGFLFKAFPEKFTNIVRLPASEIPDAIIKSDPNLRYVPKIRLESGNQAIQIGEHVVSLNCWRPYSGWARFSEDIRSLSKTVLETGLIDELERFSLKYVDLIELAPTADLRCLNLSLRFGEMDIVERPVQMRTEIAEGDHIHIIQVVSPAEAGLPGETERKKGLLVDIDTIRTFTGNGTWDELDRSLDAVHLSCKRMFFRLLTLDTLHRLEPEYGG